MNKLLALFILLSSFLCSLVQANVNQASNQNTQALPLSVAALTDEAVLTWANKQAIEIYTFYFEDIPQWREKIKKYFSSQGYKEFMQDMKKTRNLEVVVHKKLIVTPKLEGEAKLVTKGVKKGFLKDVYTWYVMVPLEVTYLGPDSKIKQEILVTLEIARQNYSDNIVINSLQVNDASESREQLIHQIKEKANLH